MNKYKKLTDKEMNESKKKFKMLTEYTFITKPGDLLLDEDDDDPNMPEDEDLPPVQAPAEDSQDQNMAMPEPEAPQADSELPVQTDAQLDALPGLDTPIPDVAAPEAGGDEMEVDVTQLTQDQEEVSNKVDNMTDQTKQMMDILSSITSKVDQMITKTAKSDEELAGIKHEIEKRNPTSKEILQKRVTLGNPFNQSPEDYWKKKEAEGDYKLEDEDEKEYEIRNSDIEDGSPMDVYRSFGLKDDELNQSMNSIFGM